MVSDFHIGLYIINTEWLRCSLPWYCSVSKLTVLATQVHSHTLDRSSGQRGLTGAIFTEPITSPLFERQCLDLHKWKGQSGGESWTDSKTQKKVIERCSLRLKRAVRRWRSNWRLKPFPKIQYLWSLALNAKTGSEFLSA